MVQFEIRDKKTNALKGTLDISGYPDVDLVEFVWNHVREDILADVNFTGAVLDKILETMNSLGFSTDFNPVDDSNYKLELQERCNDMNIHELTKDQLTQVKQYYYCQTNENVSYGELAEIDDLVSDEEIFEQLGHIDFVEDDFTNNELM